ncbi:hypothetical protein MOV66_03180 [Agrobacterium sp. SHOUNA12C]|jgi:hypothetical protein|uniref:Uncharacterized protein n=2 Tax=Rhizobium rhizogenes TaxID=359 RepID=B9JJR9_RHIR8|nr:hypothetical protein [Rhizobium rhizogenes]ACM30161.1 conserved hypothetical protein [Rhizobium rhizogenes K84]KAA6482939.1 hypothetical protein DXT98_25225 [Agrobacterium sp. ICMP 7243]MCJ9719515.1 hypothetical protein [Agrobacterium sp. BETTINA12B]MCJ9755635.1 hypothetical protein [Agrobacterium sp. SHOUNA12C]OCJ10632.1 hypothetical protein A6U88_20150 [Agrobacterium sp. B131/95]OCJ15475.1 hypothetical protein A6U89_19715 [Agrobacterium sp. B133/95]
MAQAFKIIIKNDGSQDNYFSLVQVVSTFSGAAAVFSSCLDCQFLRRYSEAGTTLSIPLDQQIYAGAQEIMPSKTGKIAMDTTLLAPSLAALAKSQTSSVQKVTLTPKNGGNVNNYTNMLVDPVGLTPAIFNAGVPSGAFCISVPPYTPPVPSYTVGNSIINEDGSVILSSFISAPPNVNVQIGVLQIYYITAAQYSVGSAMTYDTYSKVIATAAKCDFTTGYTTCNVTYNADGTFKVTQAY